MSIRKASIRKKRKWDRDARIVISGHRQWGRLYPSIHGAMIVSVPVLAAVKSSLEHRVVWSGHELALCRLSTWPSGPLRHTVSYLISFSLAAQSYLSVWPMDYSTPGLPVHHQLLELAQTHVPRVGNAIQPSHPPSSPSPPALNLS